MAFARAGSNGEGLIEGSTHEPEYGGIQFPHGLASPRNGTETSALRFTARLIASRTRGSSSSRLRFLAWVGVHEYGDDGGVG